jgi:hypothetical protein
MFALNARTSGSFAGHPEIVMVVPGFSRSL